MRSPDGHQAAGWQFFRFGLIVTGKGEALFLPRLFRSLEASGQCRFEVVRRIGQRSPITSAKRRLRMVGSGHVIPDRDAEEIGLAARRYLSGQCAFVVLVDDLEEERKPQAEQVFRRYRDALDKMLGHDRRRASVHFLVNMLEAYYFADASALNAVLGTALEDYQGDVETIRHPKNALKRLVPGFDEIGHGEQIIGRLDVAHVLSRPGTCSSLRTLFGWCSRALGWAPTDQYQLLHGAYFGVTKGQIEQLQGQT
jgi:hypothetical protein